MNREINGVMMQYFEWYLNCNKNLWNTVKKKGEELSRLGITAIWLPPAYKGIGGENEVGYGVYDLYDLGEFDQKGSIATKYGTKDEYLDAIVGLQQSGLDVYADIVLNHKMGADKLQTIKAVKCDWEDHNKEEGEEETVEVWTKFTFPGRNHKYSDFEWNWTHFDGIDYNSRTNEVALYKLKNKTWQIDVDKEHGNYDYLMGADIDFSNQEVIDECMKWGKWYLALTGVNGFRFDAVKHIESNFIRDFIREMNAYYDKNLFSVGEYWNANVNELKNYIERTEGEISLFDVPLHYNFYQASNSNGEYDLSKILDNTLMKENPGRAVTFVDNHDTQPGQALQSWIPSWFKEIAYSIILLRREGYPCIFYGDYYGIQHDNIEPMENLKTLLLLRRDRAYGEQVDYFDDKNIIGFTRLGDDDHYKSGMAVIISDKYEGSKRMYVGTKFAGERFFDALGNREDEITIGEDGFGDFIVNGGSVSVYVKI